MIPGDRTTLPFSFWEWILNNIILLIFVGAHLYCEYSSFNKSYGLDTNKIALKFGILSFTCAMIGAVLAHKARLKGMLCGAVAGFCIYTMTVLCIWLGIYQRIMEPLRVSWLHPAISTLTAFAGVIPAIILFCILEKRSNSTSPK